MQFIFITVNHSVALMRLAAPCRLSTEGYSLRKPRIIARGEIPQ